jgi:hypothetical protein
MDNGQQAGSEQEGYADPLKGAKDPMLEPTDCEGTGWFYLNKIGPIFKKCAVDRLYQIEGQTKENYIQQKAGDDPKDYSPGICGGLMAIKIMKNNRQGEDDKSGG